MFNTFRMLSIRRRSKLYRVLKLAIRQFFYALKAYNKFSSIIASDTSRTKTNMISVYKAITTNRSDNFNRLVSRNLLKLLFLNNGFIERLWLTFWLKSQFTFYCYILPMFDTALLIWFQLKTILFVIVYRHKLTSW